MNRTQPCVPRGYSHAITSVLAEAGMLAGEEETMLQQYLEGQGGMTHDI